MKNFLPDILNRSQTPMKSKFQDLSSSPIKSHAILKNPRKISVSPMRFSPIRKDSNDSFLNIRTVSDETHSVKSELDPAFRRINTLLSELDSPKPKRSLKKFQAAEKSHKFSAVAKALISMASASSDKASATNAVQLFISLGFTTDYEALVSMFKNIFDFQVFQNIFFSCADVIKICEEPRIDSILRALVQEAKDNYGKDKTEGFDCLVNIIKKWWGKLDIAKNGFVAIEDVCRFFILTGAIENSGDGRKLFTRLTHFITYRQFFGIFCKSLFKYLISDLQEVASQKDVKCLPADIPISAMRRKHMLDSILSDNKIVITLQECSNYQT